MANDIIRQKIEALFRKHSMDGTTPRKLLESNMARELRFTRDECHSLINDFNLERTESHKRKMKRVAPQLQERSGETYNADLRASR